MNPDNHDIKLASKEHDEIVKRMIKTSINKIIPYIISNFALVFNEKENIKSKNTESTESNEEHPSIILKVGHRNIIYDAFTRLYPLITYEFEKSSDKRYSFDEVLRDKPSLVSY
jgi:hypothetical protein